MAKLLLKKLVPAAAATVLTVDLQAVPQVDVASSCSHVSVVLQVAVRVVDHLAVLQVDTLATKLTESEQLK